MPHRTIRPATAYELIEPTPRVRSQQALSMWVHRLTELADHAPKESYPYLLPVMGDRRPYAFEQEKGQGPYALFHFVDRMHEPYKGIAFSRLELDRLGVVAWSKSRWCHAQVQRTLMLMDDTFVHSGFATADALRQVAALLDRIVERSKAHDVR